MDTAMTRATGSSEAALEGIRIIRPERKSLTSNEVMLHLLLP
jgi:hypothetical protein